MGQQHADALGIGAACRGVGDLVQPCGDAPRARGRGVEGEAQDRLGGVADQRHEPSIGGARETAADQHEIGERVLQQGVVALEDLDERFLLVDRRREHLDLCGTLRVVGHLPAQPAEASGRNGRRGSPASARRSRAHRAGSRGLAARRRPRRTPGRSADRHAAAPRPRPGARPSRPGSRARPAPAPRGSRTGPPS